MGTLPESAGIPLHEEQRRHIAALEREIQHVQREIAAHRHDISAPLQVLQGMVDLSPELNEELEGAPRRAVEQIRDMTVHLLRDLRRNISCTDFTEQLREVSAVTIDSSKLLHTEIELAFDAEEAQHCFLLAAKIHWKNILQNLFENAARKSAQRITMNVSWGKIGRTGQKAIEIRVSDDGEGMLPQLMEQLQSGNGVSDKTPGDGLVPGRQHGVGLKSVRMFVEKLYGGEMHIDSRHILLHPEDHGTTFTFRIPVFTCDESGAAVPVMLPPEESSAPAAPDRQDSADARAPLASSEQADVSSPLRISRRKAIGLLAGTATATAASVAGFWSVTRADSPPRGAATVRRLFPDFPLTDLETDEQGRITRFALNTNHEPVVYDANDELAARAFLRFDEPDGTSLLAFERKGVDDRIRRMFLGSSAEGVFGFVRIEAGRESRASYVCAPAASGRISRDHFYPLEDAVLLPQCVATNADLLAAEELASMEGTLRGLAAAPGPDGRDLDQRRGQIAFTVSELLRMRELRADRALEIHDARELLRAADSFLIVDRAAAESLSQRQWNVVLKSGNIPCLLAMHANEAAKLVRGGA